MDLDDFVPVGGGPLRARPVIHAAQQVGRFSTPALNHDELWQRAVQPARALSVITGRTGTPSWLRIPRA